MGSALPIVSDCRASCDCTSTVNVTQMIQDAVDEAVAETVAASARFVFENIVEARADVGPHFDRRWVLLRNLDFDGDGLGGQYTFFAASMSVDDGISVYKPDNIAVGDPGRYHKAI